MTDLPGLTSRRRLPIFVRIGAYTDVVHISLHERRAYLLEWLVKPPGTQWANLVGWTSVSICCVPRVAGSMASLHPLLRPSHGDMHPWSRRGRLPNPGF